MLPALMHQGKFYLGHLLQVPVYLGFEAIFLVFFGWYQYQNATTVGMLIGVTALLLTIVCHEFGHALVARALNMREVAITITALGGYCSYLGTPPPGKKIAITAAGPMVNFALAGASYACLYYGVFAEREVNYFCSQLFMWNLLLGCLNSFPLYPLDGGQVALAAALGLCRRRETALKFTLGLSVVAAIALVACDAYFLRGGQPSTFTMVLAVMLLFTAFGTLR
jgi:Zn-dependent protease